jgi:hypothetical protein
MTEAKPPARPRRQRAAAPKKPARKAPRKQSAAVPPAVNRTRAGQARQDPPIPADLIAHFGGQAMVDLIVHEHVPEDATAGDVLRLLLEGRRLKADLLRGDVWLSRDAAREGMGSSYSVTAKRDTLLRYASTFAEYRGTAEDAVCAKDTFKRGKPDPAARTLAERAGITHETGMPGQRGEVIGGWCVVEMAGHELTVRVLQAGPYIGTEAARAQLAEDDIVRRHPDLCMIAAAMSNALRKATNLNDVVGADELTRRPDLPVAAAPPIFEEGPVNALDARILDAYRQAQALDALLWPPAKVSAHLASAKALAAEQGGDPAVYDEARAELAGEIERDVQAAVARNRDPVALRRRLDELRAFDPRSLDAEDLREYTTELAAVEAAARAAGLEPEPATA